jgi:hypothetical protein
MIEMDLWEHLDPSLSSSLQHCLYPSRRQHWSFPQVPYHRSRSPPREHTQPFPDST